jgi:hypothetical protein
MIEFQPEGALFAAPFTLILVQAGTAPVVAAADLVSAFLTALLVLREARRAAQVQADVKGATP